MPAIRGGILYPCQLLPKPLDLFVFWGAFDRFEAATHLSTITGRPPAPLLSRPEVR